MGVPTIDHSRTLLGFATNRYSQFGEDGIIEKIFSLIGPKSRVCVEFGAWDGFHLSNTANLWTQGWKGVLIEGHRKRYQALIANVRHYDCVCINAYVASTGSNRIEALLDRAGIVGGIDLLSIDIDGDEYYILQSLEKLRPRVIICEYNPTIPAEIDLYAPYGSNFGASVTAVSRVAAEKGYRLVALTHTNAFFVLSDDAARLSEFLTDLAHLRINDSLIYLMTSYSGEYVASRPGPYGQFSPYRGNLIGPHAQLPFCSIWKRFVYHGWRYAKQMVKQVIGKD